MLQKAGDAAPVSLGAPLTADAIKQHLPAGAKLWANLPPSKESGRGTSSAADSAVHLADKLATAHYALAGVLTAKGPAYAWYHKSQLAAGPPSPNAPAHSPGCSTTSPYPVRSDRVSAGAGADLDDVSDKLNQYALKLAKVRGWIELANNPTDASMFEYYSLALLASTNDKPVSDKPLADDQLTHQGDEFRLALTSSGPHPYPALGLCARHRLPRRRTTALSGRLHGQPVSQQGRRGFAILSFFPERVRCSSEEPYGVDTLILLWARAALAGSFRAEF